MNKRPKVQLSKKPEKQILEEAGMLCEVCKMATSGQLCNDCKTALEKVVEKAAD